MYLKEKASITDPAGNITRYEYDLVFNKPVKITDALGNITTMSYDAKGNLIKAISPQLSAISFAYNSYGQPVSITDALGNTTTFEYDSKGNLIKATDPLGNSAQMQYDAIGRLIKATDAKGKSTSYVYDMMSRIKEVTDALNGKTIFAYDKNGNLLSVTDAKNQVISYEYDERDRVKKMIDQLNHIETYAYDRNDNLLSLTDRKNQTTNFVYDMMNRMIRANYADSSYTNYQYDAIGRMNYIYDSVSGPIEYAYDNAGCSAGCKGGATDKVMQEITPLGSISYTYDAIGRRTSMTVAGQPVVNYQYDVDSRLTNLVIASGAWQSLSFGLSYDAIGRRTALTLPNGITTNYTYDNGSNLLEMKHLNPLNQILEQINYVYDKNGNRISMNRLNSPVKLPNPVSNTSYNSANEMLTFKDKNMTYDNNGNMLSSTNSCGTTNYTWNARNQLVGISGFDALCSPLSAAFKYDALGRRIQKTITRTDTVTDTMYLYDGLDIIQEIKGGTVYANYIRTLHIDEPMARIKADGTVRYYQADALGSIIALTDEVGNIKTQYTYDPFGNTTTTGESSDNPFQFVGKENDGTGLIHEGYRYYSFELQRYLSQDPLQFGGGDVNWYVRTGNDPVNWVDPEGLKRFKIPRVRLKNRDAQQTFENVEKILKPHNFGGDWVFGKERKCKKYRCFTAIESIEKNGGLTKCHTTKKYEWEDVTPPFFSSPEYAKNCICIEWEDIGVKTWGHE